MNGMYTIGFIIWFSQFPFFFIERSCRRAGLPYPACCQPDQSAEEVFGIMDASGDCSVTREELAAHDTATDHYHLTPHSFDQIETADEGDEISLGEFSGWWASNGCSACEAVLGQAAAEQSFVYLGVGIGNFLTITLVGELSDCYGRKYALMLPPM